MISTSASVCRARKVVAVLVTMLFSLPYLRFARNHEIQHLELFAGDCSVSKGEYEERQHLVKSHACNLQPQGGPPRCGHGRPDWWTLHGFDERGGLPCCFVQRVPLILRERPAGRSCVLELRVHAPAAAIHVWEMCHERPSTRLTGI